MGGGGALALSAARATLSKQGVDEHLRGCHWRGLQVPVLYGGFPLCLLSGFYDAMMDDCEDHLRRFGIPHATVSHAPVSFLFPCVSVQRGRTLVIRRELACDEKVTKEAW